METITTVNKNGIRVFYPSSKQKHQKQELDKTNLRIPSPLLYIVQEGTCFFCGKPMANVSRGKAKKGYTKDHLHPRSKGNILKANKVLACYHCNQTKDRRDPKEEEISKFHKIQDKVLHLVKTLGYVSEYSKYNFSEREIKNDLLSRLTRDAQKYLGVDFI